MMGVADFIILVICGTFCPILIPLILWESVIGMSGNANDRHGGC
jgi:hypothetical protein